MSYQPRISSVFDHLHRRNETEQVSPHEPSHHFLNMTDAQLLSCISQIHTTNVQAVAHIPYLRLRNSNPQLLCTAQSKPPNNILQTPTLKSHRQTQLITLLFPNWQHPHPRKYDALRNALSPPSSNHSLTNPLPPSVSCSHIKDQPHQPRSPPITHSSNHKHRICKPPTLIIIRHQPSHPPQQICTAKV